MTVAHLSRRTTLLGSAATIAAVAIGTAADADLIKRDTTVQRHVLALYDGAIEKRLKETSVHSLAAMPLEWLGFTLEYHDIRDGLPPVWTDHRYRAVLTWFPEPNLPDYAAYVSWLEQVASHGVKIVQIGDAAPKPGSIGPATEMALRRRLFATFGVRALGQWSAVTLGDQVAYRDVAQTEFEFRFDAGLPAYELYVPAVDNASSWLVVTRADQARSTSHLIMTSSAGGFIAPGYAVGSDPETDVRQWYLDPFAFFAAALVSSNLPAADTTTLCGRRIYYSHVDGDGWRSVSQVRSSGQAPATNAEVVLRSVVAANADLPVTVAPIAAEMDPAFAGDLRAIGAARALFRLDQVEAATHTYTHPFRWEFFEDYAPEAEAPFQDAYRQVLTGRASVIEAPGQPSGSSGCCGLASRQAQSPPRAFGGRPFNLVQEVAGAAKLIEAVAAPSGKRVRLLQWPGDCLPFPAALRCVVDAGLLNINGGDTRCDKDFPSVSAVAPVGFSRNGLNQIYASNSSEELYTDLWTDRFFGFRDLPDTWDRTGAPRRLKPLNLYYHMYSAERRASLEALLSNIAALRARGDFISIFTSQFAAVAQGFFSVSFSQVAPSTWRVQNRGELQTIRFSDGDQRSVDMVSSIGVLGERVVNRHLYVALDPAMAEPVVVLTEMSLAPPARPVLRQSSWQISNLAISDGQFSFSAQGFGRGEMAWRVPLDGRWIVRVAGQVFEAFVGSERLLQIDLPALAIASTAISIAHESV